MNLKPIFGIVCVFAILAFIPAANCNPQKVLAADQIAINLTDAACTPLEAQPAGQPFVDMICTIAEGVEQTIATLEAPTAAPSNVQTVKGVKFIKIRVPADEAPRFMAAHRTSKKLGASIGSAEAGAAL